MWGSQCSASQRSGRRRRDPSSWSRARPLDGRLTHARASCQTGMCSGVPCGLVHGAQSCSRPRAPAGWRTRDLKKPRPSRAVRMRCRARLRAVKWLPGGHRETVSAVQRRGHRCHVSVSMEVKHRRRCQGQSTRLVRRETAVVAASPWHCLCQGPRFRGEREPRSVAIFMKRTHEAPARESSISSSIQSSLSLAGCKLADRHQTKRFFLPAGAWSATGNQTNSQQKTQVM